MSSTKASRVTTKILYIDGRYFRYLDMYLIVEGLEWEASTFRPREDRL